ncbi:MAG: penicillin-binding transpeptidase domain-containing protein [bacterium]
MPPAPLSRGRLRLVALLVLVGWGALLYRLTDIQVLASGELKERAEQQHRREVVLEARRGDILDRRGRVLAEDRLLHTVGVNPRLVRDTARVAALLEELTGEPASTWVRTIGRREGFFYVVRRQELASEPPPSHLLPRGVEVTETWRRTYPMGRVAAQVLGPVGVDGEGLDGIEMFREGLLSGRPGRVIRQVDATGAPIPGLEEVRQEPVAGLDLHLTLDAVVQEVLEEELARGAKDAEAEGALGVALDPRTGAVLAMASWPGFDPNRARSAPAAVRRNRVITDPFEPGSVLKIVTFAAAVDTRRYTLADTIDGGNGVIQVMGSEIRDTHAHGRMSLSEVLQVSSNVGTVKIARALGENKVYRYARDFGFGQATGVDLPGEANGRLRRLPEWHGPALESLAIGYGLNATALQVATAFGSAANGGRLLRPYIAASSEDGEGRFRPVEEVETIRRVMRRETSALLRGILTGAVGEGGTGDRAAVSGLEIAGKTGTARKASGGGYRAGDYISSFCGFLPASDPRFLLLVVVDEPGGGYYARDVAAPVFARTVRRLMSHPDRPLEGLRPAIHHVVQRPDPLIPDLRRWPASEAGKALTRRGLRVRFVGQGHRVLEQEPVPLSTAREGQVVVLHLDRAPRERAAEVPDLRGRTLREAAAAASALGLGLAAEGSGLVRSQDPGPGTSVRGVERIWVRASRPGREGS